MACRTSWLFYCVFLHWYFWFISFHINPNWRILLASQSQNWTRKKGHHIHTTHWRLQRRVLVRLFSNQNGFCSFLMSFQVFWVCIFSPTYIVVIIYCVTISKYWWQNLFNGSRGFNVSVNCFVHPHNNYAEIVFQSFLIVIAFGFTCTFSNAVRYMPKIDSSKYSYQAPIQFWIERTYFSCICIT